MIDFLLGGIAVADAVAVMLFASYYRRTRDRLFLYFVAAFGTDAITRIWMTLQDASVEQNPVAYAMRMIVYGVILAGIVDKNLTHPKR